MLPLFLLMTIVPSSSHGQDEPPLAVLMSVHGSVSVVSASGVTRPAVFGMHLHPGDEVRTGRGSSAEVLFSSGNLVEIGSNSRTGVGRRPAASQGTSPGFESVRNFLRLKESRGTSTVGRLRSGEPRRELWLERPCQSRVDPDHLVFSWKTRQDPLEVKFTLYDDHGVLWETTVGGATELRYPEDAPRLRPGTAYSWTVETADPLVIPPLRSPVGFFEVLGTEEMERVNEELALPGEREESGAEETVAPGRPTDSKRSAPSGWHLYRASVYYDHGMLDRAIEETSIALREDPSNDDLRGILARLLGEAGRSMEAVNQYDRLLTPHQETTSPGDTR